MRRSSILALAAMAVFASSGAMAQPASDAGAPDASQVGASQAQAGEATSERKARRPARDVTREQAAEHADRFFARRDANGDGRIDAADGEALRRARFERMDKDKDGMLSFAEFEAAHGERGAWAGRRERQSATLARGQLARGADHGMTQEALRAAALERFDRMDADSNGIVTAQERRAAREARRGKRQG